MGQNYFVCTFFVHPVVTTSVQLTRLSKGLGGSTDERFIRMEEDTIYNHVTRFLFVSV